MEKPTTERMIHWDLLRILACFSVIMLHSASQNWYELPVTSSRWIVYNCYNAIFRFGVPVFVMLSGCLFLSRKGELSIKRLYLHNIARIALSYVIWSCLYGLWDSRIFQNVSWKKYILEMLYGRYHLWFLPMLIGIYMLLPVLRLLTEEKNKKVLEYFLVLFVIAQIGRETIIAFQISNYVDYILRLIPLDMVASYIGYFLLGYYLQRYPFSISTQKRIYLAGFAGVAAGMILDTLLSIQKGAATATLYDSFSLATFCTSVALFVFFREKISPIKWPKNTTRIIQHLSANTFGVYLIHLWVLEILDLKNINTMMTTSILSVPLLAILCFIICNLIISFIRHIPVIGKYIC